MLDLKPALILGLIALGACETVTSAGDISGAAADPVTAQAWDQVRIGTYDNTEFARLFTQIGGYDIISRDSGIMTLQQNGIGAQIVLEEMAKDAPQARPADAQSWEPGCYWSLMMRAKDVPSIVADAESLGWLPKTPVAYLEFGPSQLNVVVLTHQETGMQVQIYERLTTPLPEDYPDFDRFGVPFNIMQMASDRDATHRFFTNELGFATWYHGDPYVSEKEEIMPLGIPVELTTSVPYRASIVLPVAGMETGRFEMIEVMGEEAGLVGRDFSKTCTNEVVGLTEVRYFVEESDRVNPLGIIPWDRESRIDGAGIVKTAPDGAMISFLFRP